MTNLINTLLAQVECEEQKNWIEVNLNNYLVKQAINGKELLSLGTMEHILDYMRAKQPKRLKKMSVEEALSNTEKWQKSLLKKGSNLIELESDVEVIKTFKKKGFRLVKLIGENAFKREGTLMSHCVASYYGKSGVDIYSLRDGQNNPHCTFEVKKNSGTDRTSGKASIDQIKGKGNGEIHPRYIELVLKCLKHLGHKVRGSELTYLGYEELSEGLWNIIDSKFDGAKYLSFDGKRYFYKLSRLVAKS